MEEEMKRRGVWERRLEGRREGRKADGAVLVKSGIKVENMGKQEIIMTIIRMMRKMSAAEKVEEDTVQKNVREKHAENRRRKVKIHYVGNCKK